MNKLGKGDASILDGDDESDVLWTLLELCGFDVEGYERIVEDDNFFDNDDIPDLVPTRENLNAQLLDPHSELNNLLSRCEIGYLDFLILGVLILKTGAVLPPELKAKILKTAAWETEEWRWKGLPLLFKEQRKKTLKDLRSRIKNHVDGKVSASGSDFWT